MAPVPLVQQQSNNPNMETQVAWRVVVSEPGAVAMGSNTQVEFMIGSLPLAVLTQRSARTVLDRNSTA